MSKRSWAIVSLVMVGLGYSLMSVATRWLAIAFEPMTQVYMRQVLAAVVASVMWRKQVSWKKYLGITKLDLVGLLLMGLVGYGLLVYFVTIGALNTTLLNVSLLYSTVPFWVGIFGFLFYRKKLGVKKALLIIFSMYGVGVVASGRLLPAIDSFGMGELFTVLAAMCAAWYVLGRKMLSNRLNDKEIALASMVIAAVSTVVMAGLLGEPFAGSGWWQNSYVVGGLVIGGVLNIVATYLEVFAFRILDGVFGAQLLLSENVWALLLGIWLYQEMPSWVQGVGAVLIIGAVYQMNRLEAKS